MTLVEIRSQSKNQSANHGRARRSQRALPATLVLAGSLLVAAPSGEARAAEPGDAERLFVEGREALVRGDASTACARFRESLALARVANTLFNVSQCDERDGKLVAALSKWREGVLLLGADDARLTVAKERLGALEQRVPKVTFTRAADLPADARVLVDGGANALAAFDTPMLFDPGEHVIVVDAPGRLPQRLDVKLVERDRKELTLAPGPSAARDAAPTATGAAAPPPPASARRIAAFVAGGIGLAGLAAFGVTGGLLLERDGRIREACPNRACSPAGRDLIEGSSPLLIANAVTLGAGIAGLGVGAVLLLTESRPAGAESAPAREARPAARRFVQVAPLVLAGGAGAAAVGRF